MLGVGLGRGSRTGSAPLLQGGKITPLRSTGRIRRLAGLFWKVLSSRIQKKVHTPAIEEVTPPLNKKKGKKNSAPIRGA